MRLRVRVVLSIAVFCALLTPRAARAQATNSGTIAGVVRDPSGAVLPGVTVEASSPALIERVRTAVTDGQGVYRIADLRPGEYAVTFTLSGFNALRREGIELSAGVTVTINGDMKVGAIEETVTVSGASPLVDVQTTAQHRTINQELIEELPTAKHFTNFAVLIPGVRSTAASDVGGSAGERVPSLSIHGSATGDLALNLDGMKTGSIFGNGAGNAGGWNMNAAMIEEFAIDTSGVSAEAETSGVRVNMIPKQGGNRYSGYMLGQFTNSALQSDNLDQELVSRGVTSSTTTKKIYDVNPAVGGPLRHDKLWFYSSYRYWGTTDQPPGGYFDSNPNDFVYTPDLNARADAPFRNQSANVRVTWQMSRNNKFAAYADRVGRCWCAAFLSAVSTPDATTRSVFDTSVYQGTWNWTATNKLLVEVGQAYRPEYQNYARHERIPPDRVPANEQRTGIWFRAPPGLFAAGNGSPYLGTNNWQSNGKLAVTYVTGSHSLKVGSQWLTGHYTRWDNTNADQWFTLLDTVPQSVTFRATPTTAISNVGLNLGLFVQEQWVVKRLTMNAGVRFDYLDAYIPEQQIGAVQFVGPRATGRIDNLPNWKDVSPRVGVAFDPFGAGKTALKWSLGRYLEGQGMGIAEFVHPLWSTVGTASTRAWADRNGDYVPQEDELGPHSNANFGRTIVPIGYAPDTVEGWGTRGWNWELMTGIQHELRPGLSAEASYHRRQNGNFRITENRLVTAADYDPYCVTAPVDARLPEGGGYSLCGLYDITGSLFGRNDNVVRLSSEFGRQSQIYDGVDVVVQGRFPGGVMFQGGTNTGRQKTNRCFVVDSPQELLYCDIQPPWQTQVKFLAVYPLPWWGFQTSATYQSLPGPEITAGWAAPASAVTGLGRPLSGNVRTVTVPLVQPGTLYGERLHQVDFRVGRNFRVQQLRLQARVDLYNLLNANPIVSQNNTYGPAWQRPLGILAGRIVKLGFELDF